MGCYWSTRGDWRKAESASGARSHVMGSCPHPPPSCELNSSLVKRSGINASPLCRNCYGAAPGYGSLYGALFELVAEGAHPPEAMVVVG